MEASESPSLLCSNGPQVGFQIKILPSDLEFVVGRAESCSIRIDNKSISRKHIKIKQDVDGIWIEDLNSKNGTLVNQKKITESILLKDSDQIQLGDLEFVFKDQNAAILNRLSTVPAFQEPEPESQLPAAEEIPAPLPKAPPVAPSSHWVDYAFVAGMVLIVLGLMVGALLWLEI